MLAVVSQFCVLDVSIHAPTRGATISLSRYLDIAGFQSTHPHGVRLTDALCVAAMILFQSTHPHGVRHCIMPTEIDVYIVSIHAPTRGATTIKIIAMTANMFQSTHPHGVRPTVALFPAVGACFNPRTHTGCDHQSVTRSAQYNEFQSTHPHGVRLTGNSAGSAPQYVSIHAPTRGATTPSCHYTLWIPGFQSTHPHGVRRMGSI